MKKPVPEKKSKIDVFITLHKKDIPALPLCVRSISKYLSPGPNRITILSDDMPADLLTEYGLNHIHESSLFRDLAFTEMPEIICKGENRTGWYFQQFLKWEARKYAETDNYVVVDADTIFIRPVILLNGNKYVFYRGRQYHMPYFRTYEKLFGYFPEKQMSYIADFMIFNTGIIDEMTARIEKIYSGRQKWYEIILDAISRNEPSSFSEFETYGYYMSKYHPDLFDSRECRNKILRKEKIPYHAFNKMLNKLMGYTSISYHCYER